MVGGSTSIQRSCVEAALRNMSMLFDTEEFQCIVASLNVSMPVFVRIHPAQTGLEIAVEVCSGGLMNSNMYLCTPQVNGDVACICLHICRYLICAPC